MKKSIIALSLLSVLSFSASAATDNFEIDLTQKHDFVTEKTDDKGLISYSTDKKVIDAIRKAVETELTTAKKEYNKYSSDSVFTNFEGKKDNFANISQKYVSEKTKALSELQSKVNKAKKELEKAADDSASAGLSLVKAEEAAKSMIDESKAKKLVSDAQKKRDDAEKARLKASETLTKTVSDARSKTAEFEKSNIATAYNAAKATIDSKSKAIENANDKKAKFEDKVKNAADVIKYNETIKTSSDAGVVSSKIIAEQASKGIDANAKGIDANAKGIDANAKGIDANAKGIEKTNTQVSKNTSTLVAQNKTLVSHDTRISTNAKNITSNTNRIANIEGDVKNLRQDFEKLSKDYNSFKKTASAGIAGVAAMANIPTAYGVGNVAVGAGIGSFNGEQAISVGVSYRANEAIAMKASIAANSGSNVEPVIGAGISYEF